MLRHIDPDLCLAVASNFGQPAKPSFAAAINRFDALVVRADSDHVGGGETHRVSNLRISIGSHPQCSHGFAAGLQINKA